MRNFQCKVGLLLYCHMFQNIATYNAEWQLNGNIICLKLSKYEKDCPTLLFPEGQTHPFSFYATILLTIISDVTKQICEKKYRHFNFQPY